MRKALLLILFGGLFPAAALSQRVTVSARVVDADTGDAVIGAVVTLTPTSRPDERQYAASAYGGSVSFSAAGYGEYGFSVSFLGYHTLDTTFRLSVPKLDLGTLRLKSGVEIETVVKEVKAMRTSQKGDTVSYNAGAFKVTADADVEGLLKKMPGITVTDGEVEAQGETVKRVFVDGKEFFGEDVTTAIKSLPAEAVDRIEVYDKLSDAAEFSGMDDGEGYKALNIVTKPGMRQGQFGKLYAGYGYDPESAPHHKYIAGGNVNIFSGDSRVSLIGLFNNVNLQNFSFEDILGVTGGPSRPGGGPGGGPGAYMMRPQSGVAQVNAIGLNYSDTWGKRDQFLFQGSYFFNNTHTTNRSTVDRWYEAPMAIDTLSTVGNSDTRNYNHRFNARLEWKISDNQNLMVRPNFSYQSNTPWSTTQGWQYGESGYSRTDNYSDRRTGGYNLRTSAIYRAKLGKEGRTLTLDGNVSRSERTNDSDTWSNLTGSLPAAPPLDPETGQWDPDGYFEPRYLRNLAPSSSYGLRGNVTYTEPVARYAQVSLQYRVANEHQERDKRVYETGRDFSTAGLHPDPMLSSAYESDYTTQRVGPGFRFSKNRNLLVANLYYQHAQLGGRVVHSDSDHIRHRYDDVTYFVAGNLHLNRENTLRFHIASSTGNPDIQDLQGIYDLSDAQNISHGNPTLNPSYSHRADIHYINSNVEKGRTFMWMFGMQSTSDYIGTFTAQNPTLTIDGVTYRPNFYSTPVNLDGYLNLRTHVSYGFPIGFLSSNFNVMAGLLYTRTPGMTGGSDAVIDASTGRISGGSSNTTANMGYDFRAVLGSNISERADFTLAWNGTYNEMTNSLSSSRSKNRYFTHAVQGDLKIVFPLGITLTASASYRQYLGFTNDYDDNFLLCNAYIGKKLFKNQRGELLFGVNDLFNQNKSFVRTTGSGWTQNATNSVIGRYFMVQFTFNLRRFGKRGSTDIRDYEGVAPDASPRPGMRGMPRPPHGIGPH